MFSYLTSFFAHGDHPHEYDQAVLDYSREAGGFDYSTDAGLSAGAITTILILTIAASIFMIAATWRIYTKAGRPGWASIVPIYNTLQLLWTIHRPWWWILLLFIPIVNIFVLIMMYYYLAKAFGKGLGFTALLLLLPIIGLPMLAWGNAKYKLKKPANGR